MLSGDLTRSLLNSGTWLVESSGSSLFLLDRLMLVHSETPPASSPAPRSSSLRSRGDPSRKTTKGEGSGKKKERMEI